MPARRIFSIAILLCSLSPLLVSAQPAVRKIEIHSGWGGLGTPQKADILIRRENHGYTRDGSDIASELVDALLAALHAPVIAKPNPENLGLTAASLDAQIAAAEHDMPGRFPAAPSQVALFEKRFRDPAFIVKVLPQLFQYASFDDYPGASIQVTFDDRSHLTACSNSYYPFMIPWKLGERAQW